MAENLTEKEQKLLLRIAAGDERAFAELVRKYDSLVFSFIYKIIPIAETAEEMVSDVFLRIWQTREALTDVRNFGTYLYVISRNHAFNAFKKELREKKRLEEWASFTSDASGALERENEALDLIDEALQQLTPQQQKIWILSRREAKSYHDIEQELLISKNTVKTHLRSANRAIKEYVLKRLVLLIVLFLSIL